MNQPEQSFTVTQSALANLVSALQAHLTNSQNARAALAILPSLDQALVAAFNAFQQALTAVVPTAPVAVPSGEVS